MADDPTTRAGRAEMRRKAEDELREAQAAARAWAATVDKIDQRQREAGDPIT
jgi:hypothetical protein